MTLIKTEMLTQFGATQTALLTELFRNFPLADQGLLHDIPKKGELVVDGEEWEFQKHGLGVKFHHSDSGRVVDAHRLYGRIFDLIDAWRILQFAESLGIYALTEQAIEDSLQSSAKAGDLLPLEQSGLYRLVSHAKS